MTETTSRERSPHIRRPESYWQSIIDQHANSGLSQRVFCNSHDIPFGTFSKWRHKLKPAATVNAPFLELVEPLSSPSSAGWTVELTLDSGAVLRVR